LIYWPSSRSLTNHGSLAQPLIDAQRGMENGRIHVMAVAPC